MYVLIVRCMHFMTSIITIKYCTSAVKYTNNAFYNCFTRAQLWLKTALVQRVTHTYEPQPVD